MYIILAYIYPSFVYTKLFWKIVKKNFEENPGKPYLCLRSSLFEAYWQQKGQLIIELSKEFQNETQDEKISVYKSKNCGFLFWTTQYKKDEEVRTLFINWCINKYSK